MMSDVFIFTAKLYKHGTEEVVDEVQVLAYELFQATHIIFEYVTETDKYKFQVEVGNIERVRSVNNIVNAKFASDILMEVPDLEYDGSIPLQIAASLPEEETISFECYCQTRLRIPANMEFPYVTCPNEACGNIIKKSEIKLFGKDWIYDRDDDKGAT